MITYIIICIHTGMGGIFMVVYSLDLNIFTKYMEENGYKRIPNSNNPYEVARYSLVRYIEGMDKVIVVYKKKNGLYTLPDSGIVERYRAYSEGSRDERKEDIKKYQELCLNRLVSANNVSEENVVIESITDVETLRYLIRELLVMLNGGSRSVDRSVDDKIPWD